MPKKSWNDKFNSKTEPEVKITEKAFWGMPAGSRMLIPTPKLIQDYIFESDPGMLLDLKTMRDDLAAEHHADFTCPLTTGIFLRIVAEANFEKKQGSETGSICPFWRIIDPKSDLAKKLSFGTEFIREMRAAEQLNR
jgi:hypothetical protein